MKNLKIIKCLKTFKSADTCNVLPSPAVPTGLVKVKIKIINVKFKMNLKYRGHVYSEPVCLHITYQVRAWVHFINSMRKSILQRVSQVRKRSDFPILMLKLKEEMRLLLKKLFWIRKKWGKL